jgi:putative ABC transport system permease protein
MSLDRPYQDVKYAARALRNNAGFAAVAAITLALGIGANTAIFSVVKTVLIEALPYAEPHRLVHIVEHLPASQTIDARPRSITAMDLAEFLELRSQAQTISSLGAYDTPREVTLTAGEEPVRVIGTPISDSLFQTLGVQPLIGRELDAQSIVLSHGMWQSYFGSDPDILTRALTLDGRSYSIAGVMPPQFELPNAQSQFWLPLDLTPPTGDEVRTVFPIARLEDGTPIEAAVAEATSVIRNVRSTYPPDRVAAPGQFEFVTVQDRLVQPVRSALLVLTVAVGLVLLIACSNVANLLLARGTARRGEFAIRSALGAGRGRLISQTLTESALLAIIGGTAGSLVAFVGVEALQSLEPDIPRLESVNVDAGVLLFTLALSVASSLAFGLLPALHLSRSRATGATRASTRIADGLQPRNAIIVCEIGLAVMLLIGGALLIRSFLNLSDVDPGFDPSNVLMFQVALPDPALASTLTESMTSEFLERIGSIPGVESVGFTNAVPLVARTGFSQPRIEGTPIGMQGIPEFREVSTDYLAVMGMRLVAGRRFDARDERGQPRAAIINRTMARYFGAEDPLGKTITLASDTAEIVGIVEEIHEQGLNVEPRPQVYIDSRQSLLRPLAARALNSAYFVVRVGRDPISIVPSVRDIVGQAVPNSTLRLNVASMDEIVSRSIARPRFTAVLLAVFGGVAVLLATIGVYGITAYSVAQRTREIGIRVALGAQAREVVGLVLRHSLLLAVLGVGLGVAGALLLTRYLSALLFGLTPLDPTTFILVSAAFLLTVALASLVPARRAMRVDPVVALRHE